MRPSSWLQSARESFVPRRSHAAYPFTAEAGRLATRARRGGPSRRWEDSITDARTYVDSARLTGILRFSSRRKSAQRYSVKSVQTLSAEQLERFDNTGQTSN